MYDRSLPDFGGVATLEYAPHPERRDERSREEPGAATRPARSAVWRARWAPSLRVGPDRGSLGRIGQFDVGSGDWDARRRPSEVRLDRVLQLDPARVRREGATLDQGRFEAVAQALRNEHRWA